MGLRCLDRLLLGMGMTMSTIIQHPAFVEKPFDTAWKSWVIGGRKIAADGSLSRTQVSWFQPRGNILNHRRHVENNTCRSPLRPFLLHSVALIRGFAWRTFGGEGY